MNGNGENSSILHDPRQALDEYIDKLLVDTSTGVEEVAPSMGADKEPTPVLVLGSAEDSQQDLPADPSSIQLEDVVVKGQQADRKEYARTIQERIYESNPEPHQQSIIQPIHPDQGSVVLESKEIADIDNGKDTGADAEPRYSHLKFQVAGLNLVIPYQYVHGDRPWYIEKFAEINGPQWLLGETQIEGHCVKLVDIAPLVIPQSRHTALLSPSRSAFNHVLMLNDTSWGVACNKIEGGIDLQAAQIQWRSERGKRPWLAGTIVSEKSALLDVDAILCFLESGRWDG